MLDKVSQKKIFNLLLFVGICVGSTSLFAESKAYEDMSEMQRFHFDLGVKSAKRKYMKEGYALAISDFKKSLAKYSNKVKAQQASKYLIEEGKITYPEVYRIREGDSFRIKITAPKVEPSFTAEDLFILPLYKHLKNLDRTSYFTQDDEDEAGDNTKLSHLSPKTQPSLLSQSVVPKTHDIVRNPNAFGLPDLNTINSKNPRLSKPNKILATNELYIPYKSSTVEGFLNSYGSKYSETRKGYKVFFSNQKERDRFCTALTGDTSCKDLKQ